ncbi:MAG: IS1595 family transposase [Candidatus Levyibacteriota bacterium]
MLNKYQIHSHISEVIFRHILKHFCLDIPASKTAALTGVNRNSVNSLYRKLRQRALRIGLEEAKQFLGEVEVDESYFGAKRIRGKRGRGAQGKTPVVGLLKRQGHVFTKIVANCTREELMPIIRGKVLTNSTVYTDGWRSYDSLVLNGYKHYRIHHHENEFARGKNHVNGIESFWSFAKTRMAKLRGIRKEHFLLHLKESEWRWNHRNEDIYKLLLKELRNDPLN